MIILPEHRRFFPHGENWVLWFLQLPPALTVNIFYKLYKFLLLLKFYNKKIKLTTFLKMVNKLYKNLTFMLQCINTMVCRNSYIFLKNDLQIILVVSPS